MLDLLLVGIGTGDETEQRHGDKRQSTDAAEQRLVENALVKVRRHCAKDGGAEQNSRKNLNDSKGEDLSNLKNMPQQERDQHDNRALRDDVVFLEIMQQIFHRKAPLKYVYSHNEFICEMTCQ